MERRELVVNIQWCGFLNHPDDLEKANVEGFEKMKDEESDIIFGLILLAIPLFFGVMHMMSIKGMTLTELLVGDIIGLLILIPIFILHELIHALCCPRHAQKQIYWHKLTLITYCKEPMDKTQMMIVLLAPNVLLGCSSYMLWMLGIVSANPLLDKVLGLMILVLLLGAVWDLSLAVTIMIRTPSKAVVCLSGEHIYYKDGK